MFLAGPFIRMLTLLHIAAPHARQFSVREGRPRQRAALPKTFGPSMAISRTREQLFFYPPF